MAESPGLIVVGLTEQLIVGGSNAFTVKLAEQSAVWPGFRPSLPDLPSLTVALHRVAAGIKRGGCDRGRGSVARCAGSAPRINHIHLGIEAAGSRGHRNRLARENRLGAHRARQGHRRRRRNGSDMDDNARAQPRGIDIGATAVRCPGQSRRACTRSRPGRDGWRDDG